MHLLDHIENAVQDKSEWDIQTKNNVDEEKKTKLKIINDLEIIYHVVQKQIDANTNKTEIKDKNRKDTNENIGKHDDLFLLQNDQEKDRIN